MITQMEILVSLFMYEDNYHDLLCFELLMSVLCS